jgi:hypothetical protein
MSDIAPSGLGAEIDASRLERLLGHLLDSGGAAERGTAVCIWGTHGIGKTMLVEQFAAERGWQFAYCAPAQFEEMGDFHGLPRHERFDGRAVTAFAPLAVAVDTSGSIRGDELALFYTEIHGIWRAGAEVHVLECDARVARVHPYEGHSPDFAFGRGGTAFDPVFAWLRNDSSTWDGCVYLTDGRGPVPEIRPPCPVLWVVTAGGYVDSLRFGRAVRLRDATSAP